MEIKDAKYLEIVDDILNNDDFLKLKEIEHHDRTRYDHSLKISYKAYKLAKKFKLDTNAVARAGLLHDFVISDKNRSKITRVKDTFTHPKKALKESKKRFSLSKKEENIILAHMFPINITLPKYKESWIVVLIDKTYGGIEMINMFKKDIYILMKKPFKLINNIKK